MIPIEFEATFQNINVADLRNKLEGIGAAQVHEEQLLSRVAFNLPTIDSNAFVRVRNEFGKITMTYKSIKGDTIDGQKEVELDIDNFENGIVFLRALGCNEKAYQETKRETWKTGNGVMVTIDTWPFLETFVEIEGENELDVRTISEELGFKWVNAIFDGVTLQYANKYHITKERINDHTPKIMFDMENPFL